MSFLIFIFRRKERLSLVLLGLILISLAAGLAVATAKSTQGTIDEELAEHWRTDYDLLVRHPATVSDIEKDEGIINSKFQSNNFDEHYISWSQLKAIRSIDGVEVAAPLAVVGPVFPSKLMGMALDYDDLEPGIYREVVIITRDNGIEEISTQYTRYLLVHPSYEEEFGENYKLLFSRAGFAEPPFEFNMREFTMNIVAVDFQAEAALHGLDNAILEGSIPEQATVGAGIYEASFPVVINSLYGPDGVASVSVSRLADFEPTRATLELLARTDDNLLVGSREELVKEFTLAMDEIFQLPELGSVVAHTYARAPGAIEYIRSNGDIAVVASSTGGTFGLVVDDQSVHGVYNTLGANQMFRQVLGSGRGYGMLPFTYGFVYHGLFDPQKLSVQSPDSPVAAPLEIFHLSDDQVLAGLGGVHLPAGTYAKSIHPYDFAGSPIAGIIPIEAIQHLPQVRIGSVRVRVSGVDAMTEESQLRIQYIARQIEEITGLHVDIVLGSSRQRTPIYLYSYDNPDRQEYLAAVNTAMEEAVSAIEQETGLPTQWRLMTLENAIFQWYDTDTPTVYLPRVSDEKMEELMFWIGNVLDIPLRSLGYRNYEFETNVNYHREVVIYIPDYNMAKDEPRNLYGIIEQYWTQQGTQMRIYYETNRGTFWISLAMLTVGMLFIGNTTYISAVGRTGEFAALKAIGWRRSTVLRISFLETLAISLFAGLITAGVLSLIWFTSERYLEPGLMVLTVPVIIAVFLLGSFPPLVRTVFIPPLRGVRQGELRNFRVVGGFHPLGFILRSIFSRPGRTLITSFAIIVPGFTLSFIYFIYFGIQALYGKTLLGEYLAIELSGYHFILNALVFAVAGLVVTDTLLINLRERQKEFGLLKAVGWRNSSVAGLLFWEGVGLGLLGGIIGTGIAAVVYTRIFGMEPPDLWLNGPLMALIPALVAGLAAIVPAAKAALIPAAQVIKAD